MMVWELFSWYDMGPLHKIEGIINFFICFYISRHPEQCNGTICHTSKIVKEWFSDNYIEVLKWPALSPGLNPIDNFCNDIKTDL